MPLESSNNKHTVTLQCYNRSNWLIQSLFALKSIWHVSWCYARATDEYLLRLNNSSRTNIIEWWANVFRHLKRDGCYDFIRMTWESVYVILRHHTLTTFRFHAFSFRSRISFHKYLFCTKIHIYIFLFCQHSIFGNISFHSIDVLQVWFFT